MFKVSLGNKFEEKYRGLSAVENMGVLNEKGVMMLKVMCHLKCLVSDYSLVNTKKYFETRMKKQVDTRLVGNEHWELWLAYQSYVVFEKVND